MNGSLRHSLAAAARGLLLASAASAAGNLIVNGSFESGASSSGATGGEFSDGIGGEFSP